MLPHNLYYTLPEAAKELKCDIGKLFHLAANGYLSLCTKVYESTTYQEEFNFDWGCDLLIREAAIVKSVSDGEVSLLSTDSYTVVNDDLVTRYSRLSVGIQCFLNEGNNEIVDFNASLYGIYGLLKIKTMDIFIHENDLALGKTVSVRAFELPIDNVKGSVSGFFSLFKNELDSDWRSNTIDTDRYDLRDSDEYNSVWCVSHGIDIHVNNLYITECEMNRIKGVTKNSIGVSQNDIGQKFYKLPDFCKTLVCLATNMMPDEVDRTSSEKLKIKLQKVAAKQGVEFPDLYHSTLAKYIGKLKK